MGKTVLEAKVVDIEKRRYPSKHYVYVIEVVWSEGTRTLIYRRYSHFFEFQCGLLEKFPTQAGSKNPADRCIPFLPGKKMFGRSHVRSVAEKRMGPISAYCQALIRLPQELSQDPYILNFFEVTPEDINPPKKKEKSKKTNSANEISDPILLEQYTAIADYKKQKNTECSLTAGQIVEVIDRNENGWWFVHMDDLNEGWVPATYLEPIYGQNEATKPIILEPGEEEICITTSNYTAKNSDEISFERGVLVEVYQKGLDGWWKARYHDKDGYVPACYLTRYYGNLTHESGGPTQVVSTVQEAVDATILSSGSASRPKSPRPSPAKPQKATNTIAKFSIKPGVDPYADEPIYAPTPRKETIQVKKSVVQRPPPAIPQTKKTRKNKTLIPPTRSSSSENYETPADGVYHEIPGLVQTPQLSVDRDSDSDEDVFHDYETLSEHYMTLADFKSEVHDGLSFSAGKEVSVITKNPSGWWFVEMGKEEGWVPSSYLERVYRPHGYALPTEKSTIKPEPVTTKPSSTSVKSEAGVKPSRSPEPKVVTAGKINVLSSSKSGPILSKPTPVSNSRSEPTKPRDKDLSENMLRHNTTTTNTNATTITTTGPKPPPVAKKPVSYQKSADSTSTVAAMAAVLSKGISNPKLNSRPSQEDDTISRSSTVSDIKPSVPRRVPTKSAESEKLSISRNSLKRSSSSDSVREVENINDIRLTKSPPPLRPRPKEFIPPPKPKSKDSSQLGMKFLRKSNENLLAAQENEEKPSSPQPTPRKNITIPQKSSDSPRPIPQTATMISAKTTREKPPPPTRTPSSIRPFSTQTIKLGELENALQSKKGLPAKREKSIPSRSSLPISGKVTLTGGKSPPKRPQAAPSVKKAPPPRPSNSPALNRKPSYVTIADYVGDDEGSLSFKEGDNVEVLEKSEEGWWFVRIKGKEGWVPSTFIEKISNKPDRPKPPPPSRVSSQKLVSAPKVSENSFRAISDYTIPLYEDSGINLVAGQIYEVLEKTPGGWWFVQHGLEKGWAPSSFLEPV